MDSDEGKLFVGGIAWDTTEEKLKEHFEKYGQVKEAVIMRDKLTGRPRGFGFVVFDDPSNVDRVIQDKHCIDGRTVEAKRALSREEQRTSQNPVRSIGGAATGTYKTKKIFVGGLPTALTEEEFREYFGTYGNVTDVVIMYDPNTKRPRGFGFITFDSEIAVNKVLHKNFHDLNNKLVEVKPALPKEVSPGGAVVGQIGSGYGPSSYPTTFDGQPSGVNRLMQIPTSNGPFVSYPNYVPTFAYPMPNNTMGYGGGAYSGYSGGYVATGFASPSTSYLGGPSGPMSNQWSNQYPGYIGGAVSGLLVPTMYGNYVGPGTYMSSRNGNGPKRNVVTSSRARGQHGGSPAWRSDS